MTDGHASHPAADSGVGAVACIVCGCRMDLMSLPHPAVSLLRCGDCGFARKDDLDVHHDEQNLWSAGEFRGYRDFTEFHVSGESWRRTIARQRLQWLEERIPTARLLDVGCAVGFFVDEAVKRGWHAEGIDLSASMIGWGRKNLGLDGLAHGKGYKLPYESGTFDLVTCFDTLGYSEQPLDVLSEFARVLAQGGHLYMTNLLADHVLESKPVVLSYNYYFTLESLNKATQSCAFEPEEVWYEPKNLNTARPGTSEYERLSDPERSSDAVKMIYSLHRRTRV